MLKAGAQVQAYDPKAAREAQRYLGERPGVTYTEDSYSTLQGCDALLIVTEWSYFKNPDYDRIKSLLAAPVVFDGRNIYSTELMKMLGFDYFSIGRQPVLAHSQAWASRIRAAV